MRKVCFSSKNTKKSVQVSVGVGLWGIVQYLSQDKLLMEVSGSYSPLFYCERSKSRGGAFIAGRAGMNLPFIAPHDKVLVTRPTLQF